MKKLVILALAGAVSTSFASLATAADNDPTAYKAMRDKAATEYKMAKEKCSGMSGNAKDVCKEEAKVARARMESDAIAEHKSDSTRDLQRAREKVAKAEYKLAKEKCDDMSGDAKSSCIKEARATEATSIADARRGGSTATLASDQTPAGTTATTGAATTAGAAADRTAATADRMGDRTAAAADNAGNAASDTMITTKVKADFAADDQVKAMDVHVETVKGVVMLSGFVDSKAEADKAVMLARKVKGVSDVKSSLQVKK